MPSESVKETRQVHTGTIHVANEEVSNGQTFHVNLPLFCISIS
jgi:hypothetical protein